MVGLTVQTSEISYGQVVPDNRKSNTDIGSIMWSFLEDLLEKQFKIVNVAEFSWIISRTIDGVPGLDGGRGSILRVHLMFCLISSIKI